MVERPEWEGPGAEPVPLEPHLQLRKLALLAMPCSAGEWPKFLEGHVGTEPLCPSGPGTGLRLAVCIQTRKGNVPQVLCCLS